MSSKKQKPAEPSRSRAEAQQSQHAAAALLGVHWRTWQNWESGLVPIPQQMLLLYRHLAGLERIPFRGVDYPRPE